MKKLGVDLLWAHRNQSACDHAMADAENEMGNINQYSIYVDVCTKFDSRKGERYALSLIIMLTLIINQL